MIFSSNLVVRSSAFRDHEDLVAVLDSQTGLRAFIAIHSTALGPALGGCRMKGDYASEQEAVDDSLNLSYGMTRKNAVAGLPFGGGKAVIYADPATRKTPDLLAAFGRAVTELQGRYWTAEDMNIQAEDLPHMNSAFVAGLKDDSIFASGDPSPFTARGVCDGIERAVRVKLNRSLEDVTVAIQGVGGVGGKLAHMLAQRGARLIVADPSQAAIHAVDKIADRVVRADQIALVEADVFAPCAGSNAITASVVEGLKARIVAGAANVQLARPDLDKAMADKGILYAPDFVINGGGTINVSAEILARRDKRPYDPDWVNSRIDQLIDRLEDILRESSRTGEPTEVIANRLADTLIRDGAKSH